VELIEGELVDMAPIGNRHGYAVDLPAERLLTLVVEISDSTLRKDLHVKTPLYARYGVPEVWIVDLENNCIRFFRHCLGPGSISRHCL
jgi:Uma2 family endonuclease